MTSQIDLNYRPKTYFNPTELDEYLLSKLKGAFLRTELEALFRAGRRNEMRNLRR